MKQSRSWGSRNLWVVGVAGVVLGGLLTASSGALGGAISFARPRLTRPSPVAKYFEIAVNGIPFTNTDFTNVSAIGSSSADGSTTYEPINIMRHFMGPDQLTQWRDEIVRTGVNAPREVTITYYDASLRPIRRVLLQDAWPSGWQTPPMDTSGGDLGLEVIRLTFTRAVVR